MAFEFENFCSKLGLDLDKNLDIHLKKVSFRDDKSLKVEFINRAGLDTKVKEKIREALVTYFKEYETEVGFEDDVIEKTSPKEIIKNVISRYPSNAGWVAECKIERQDKDFKIYCPYNILHNGDFVEEMKKQMNAELGAFDEGFRIDFLEDGKNTDSLLLEDIEKEAQSMADEKAQIKEETKTKKEKAEEGSFKWGKGKLKEVIMISDLRNFSDKVCIKAKVFKIDTKDVESDKGKFRILSLYVNDKSGSVIVKVFLKNEKIFESENFKKNKNYFFVGSLKYDNFAREEIFSATYIEEAEEDVYSDLSEEKRVELRLHSNMSMMEGVNDFRDFLKRASSYGHKALAITDRASVQGFPDAAKAGKDLGIKIIYGLDGYLVDDEIGIIQNYKKETPRNRFVVFDLETTGLSPRKDKIVEIGAVKIVDNEIVDRFSALINPQMQMSQGAEEITGLSNALLDEERTIEEVLPEFLDFIEDSVLVAHNSDFDTAFIRREMKAMGKKFDYAVLDTLKLAPSILEDLRSYTLSNIAKNLGVILTRAHRAVNDAEATAGVLLKLLDLAAQKGASSFEEINKLYPSGKIEATHGSPCTILVKNQIGMKNLYKIVSESHMNYYFRSPKIPMSLFKKYREGLLLGSGNYNSYLFDGILYGKDDDEILRLASVYDYLEIQPESNANVLIVSEKLNTTKEIQEINKKIYELGQKLGKLVIASGDVFYLEPQDDLIRRIILNGDISNFDKYKNVNNFLYFKSTKEMLEDFSYLGDEIAKEVVITNTNKIADSIEDVYPVPDGTFPPVIEGSEEELTRICYENARKIYGQVLPQPVEKRLKRELDSIIKNGYAVLYIIAQKLVKKSNDDGYIVGSRGSVGSSFAATMAGITEVNPLPPHYVCPNCKNADFIEDLSIGSGVDLEDKICPKCGTPYKKEGQNIPFEVFLGFDGDKEPDIDLNFAGEYQWRAHKYTEDLFGEGYVFRAGTVGTVAEKTAYGYVKKYFEGQNINNAEVERLVQLCMGIKRTSGQHPGGVMICPKSKEIFDFTPIQYPADDKSSGVITTHFAYEHISGRILKLDILGHDGPTIIKMLETITGFDSKNIDLGDKRVMELFASADPLKLNKDILDSSTGTLGIPEFGTNFVKQMLLETRPQNFSELVRISGLSHGTDVWTNNAQELVRAGKAELKDVISTREDIMLYLINAGAEDKMAFMTMEKVRKGKGLSPEAQEAMKGLSLPPWYIDSCQKIKYMFPKAHAVAYVMLSFRIAYYKLFYPLAFYATYFTIKLQDLDGILIAKGAQAVIEKMEEIKNQDKQTAKDKSTLNVLEVVLEMYARGFEFEAIDIYKSESKTFKVSENNKIVIPFRAMSGLGDNLAEKIVEDRKNGPYISIEDFAKRTGAGRSIMDAMRDNNLFKGMQELNQISLFNF
ncbi:DNA polymerase III, alpha subunit [Clostridiales bacterium KA00134]|nr:DNA polymerase III, alpha subunit [Clostridiales bacterium KA00134]